MAPANWAAHGAVIDHIAAELGVGWAEPTDAELTGT